jgi:DNA transposition AAA+ family ATPase
MSNTLAAVPAPPFLMTIEYRRFAEFCDACQRYRYIGVCHGPPGVGKTLSARHYAHWDQLDPVTHDAFQRLERPAELVNWRTVVYTPPVLASPKRLENELLGECALLSSCLDALLHPDEPFTLPRRTYTQLILIDEADRLKVQALEQVRDIYDRMNVGMVLIGMPGLEKRLARYPQLYSRVGFVHPFRLLSSVELQRILQQKWQELGLTFAPDDLEDAQAQAAVARITNGNFRLIQRLFSQIQRIMEINHLTQITEEVVQAARESLVIGPT